MFTMQKDIKVEVKSIKEFNLKNRNWFIYKEEEKGFILIHVVDKETGFALPVYVENFTQAKSFLKNISEEKMNSALERARKFIINTGIQLPLNIEKPKEQSNV